MTEGQARQRERFIYLRELGTLPQRAEGATVKSMAAEPPRPWIYLRITR